MSSANGSPSPAPAVDNTPLLAGQSTFRSHSPILPPIPSLRATSSFFRRRRAMREPSVRVREAATEQIEERQTDWAHSKPIVFLCLVRNLVFVVVAISVLIVTRHAPPSMPFGLWIVGYAMQCVLQSVCVWAEYKKRNSPGNAEGSDTGQLSDSRNSSSSNSGSGEMESSDHVSEQRQSDDDASDYTKLEAANTAFSCFWWVIGFYLVSPGGQEFPSESPALYWLTITFLVFDAFFIIIGVLVACLIGLAICCCLPCIIELLHVINDQNGANNEDIERLPRFKFRKIGVFEKENGEIQESFRGIMTECDTDFLTEHVLPLEDAECCICLCAYEDGTELCELPCRHHFHSACIVKWLHIKFICPLCKFNIPKNRSQTDSEEV